MVLGVVVGVVDTDDERCVLVLGGRGDDDLLRTGLDVGLGGVGVGEETGRLDDDVDVVLTPGEVLRVPLRGDDDALAADDDGLVVVVDILAEAAEDGVELQQVRQGLVVGQVVDRDNLDVGAALEDGAEVVASDTTEAVDAYTNRHCDLLCPVGTMIIGMTLNRGVRAFIPDGSHCTDVGRSVQ